MTAHKSLHICWLMMEYSQINPNILMTDLRMTEKKSKSKEKEFNSKNLDNAVLILKVLIIIVQKRVLALA